MICKEARLIANIVICGCFMNEIKVLQNKFKEKVMEKENKNYKVKIVYHVPKVVNQKALFELHIKESSVTN